MATESIITLFIAGIGLILGIINTIWHCSKEKARLKVELFIRVPTSVNVRGAKLIPFVIIKITNFSKDIKIVQPYCVFNRELKGITSLTSKCVCFIEQGPKKINFDNGYLIKSSDVIEYKINLLEIFNRYKVKDTDYFYACVETTTGKKFKSKNKLYLQSMRKYISNNY